MAINKADYINPESGNVMASDELITDIIDGINTNETAIAGIIDSGSNTNGSYIKFSDGTQICWISLNLGSITIDSMTVSSNHQWVFPSAFVGNPSVQISNQALSADWIRSSFYALSPTTVSGISLFNNFSGPLTQNHTLHIQAIGRWK